jgi:hypothetical protein
MQQLVYLIPLFPLVSFAILALAGKNLPKESSFISGTIQYTGIISGCIADFLFRSSRQ